MNAAPHLDQIIRERISIKSERLGVLTGTGVSSGVLMNLGPMHVFIIRAEDTNLRDLPLAEQAKAAKFHGLVFIDPKIDNRSLLDQRAIYKGIEMHSRLPLLPALVAENRINRPQASPWPDFLTASSVDSNVIDHLRRSGLIVVERQKSRQRNQPAHVLARFAKENDFVLLSSRRNFGHPDHHYLPDLPGVVVTFSDNANDGGKGHDMMRSMRQRDAMNDLLQRLRGKTADELHGTNITYLADGTLTLTVPPYRPDKFGFMTGITTSHRFLNVPTPD